MTRMLGLREMGLILEDDFGVFDKHHYAVENKLINLKRSIEKRRREGDWQEEYSEKEGQ